MIATLCSVFVSLAPVAQRADWQRFDFNPPNAEREAKEFAQEVIYGGFDTSEHPSVVVKCWEE